jgi:hypothetical protein
MDGGQLLPIRVAQQYCCGMRSLQYSRTTQRHSYRLASEGRGNPPAGSAKKMRAGAEDAAVLVLRLGTAMSEPLQPKVLGSCRLRASPPPDQVPPAHTQGGRNHISEFRAQISRADRDRMPQSATQTGRMRTVVVRPVGAAVPFPRKGCAAWLRQPANQTDSRRAATQQGLILDVDITVTNTLVTHVRSCRAFRCRGQRSTVHYLGKGRWR